MSAASTTLFSVTDLPGDAYGDGTYRLPTGINPANLDLRTFTAENNNGALELRLTMARLENPRGAPLGFSIPVFDLFIGPTRSSSIRTQTQALKTSFDGLGFQTSPGTGWQYHIRVTGWSAQGSDSSGKSFASNAHVEGTEVVILTALPTDEYAYWGFVSLYDPLTADGLAHPETAPSEKLTAAVRGSPPPLDLLSDASQKVLYQTREVKALANSSEDRSVSLLYIGILGLSLALVATIFRLMANRTKKAREVSPDSDPGFSS